jgi:adenosine/AMP kinase
MGVAFAMGVTVAYDREALARGRNVRNVARVFILRIQVVRVAVALPSAARHLLGLVKGKNTFQKCDLLDHLHP